MTSRGGMKRPRAGKRPLGAHRTAAGDPDIDARYGLEPVFEPGSDDSSDISPERIQFRAVRCPYCGEIFETSLDVSAGPAVYVEDCQVCCRPIEFRLEVDSAGALASLITLRGD